MISEIEFVVSRMKPKLTETPGEPNTSTNFDTEASTSLSLVCKEQVGGGEKRRALKQSLTGK